MRGSAAWAYIVREGVEKDMNHERVGCMHRLGMLFHQRQFLQGENDSIPSVSLL
jgi:hypothetical protein